MRYLIIRLFLTLQLPHCTIGGTNCIIICTTDVHVAVIVLSNLNILPYKNPLESPELPEDLVCCEIVEGSKKDYNPHCLKLMYVEIINNKCNSIL